MSMYDGVRAFLSRDLNWASAVENLRQLYARCGATAHDDAIAISRRYMGHRAVMVFDVIASRQRRFDAVVRGWISRFEATHTAESLSALAELGPPSGFGFKRSEPETMRGVAAGLLRYGREHGFDDDDACATAWANACGVVEVAPKLDPYVGNVKGIGPALFCYLRMLCGADAIKPDVRVRAALRRLGFNLPGGDVELLLVASAVAAEIEVDRLVLDQLLWYAKQAPVG
jgi:hypothetical protein